MTIEQWGSLGELIAAVATIATLGYLALQIRLNAKSAHGATAQAIMENEIASGVFIAQYANIYRRGNESISELDADEAVVYEEIVNIEISQMWSAFSQYQSGLTSFQIEA
jgi:hypothetical protein